MAIDLTEYVPVLIREVNPPGQNVYPGATDATWMGYLSDAFWEVRLDGFLKGFEATLDTPTTGEVAAIDGSATDPPREMMAMVVLYAGIRALRNQIMNLNTSFKAKAGPVEFEQQRSATMLAEMLKGLRETKIRILLQLGEFNTNVTAIDAYSTRLYSEIGYGVPPASYYGGLELT